MSFKLPTHKLEDEVFMQSVAKLGEIRVKNKHALHILKVIEAIGLAARKRMGEKTEKMGKYLKKRNDGTFMNKNGQPVFKSGMEEKANQDMGEFMMEDVEINEDKIWMSYFENVSAMDIQHIINAALIIEQE